jgi:hypothetical protein
MGRLADEGWQWGPLSNSPDLAANLKTHVPSTKSPKAQPSCNQQEHHIMATNSSHRLLQGSLAGALETAIASESAGMPQPHNACWGSSCQLVKTSSKASGRRPMIQRASRA